MRRDGLATRNKILDATRGLVLKYGYGGMSIDDVIAKAGITKGALFYHFDSKEDLARVLLQRYAEHDRAQLDELLRRAEKLSNDPAQQLLIVLGLYIEFLESTRPIDGCLYASFCYEGGLMDASTMKPVKEMVLYWRETLAAKIREALRAHKTRIPVDPVALADQALVTIEGAFVLSKTLNDFKIMVRQLEQLKAYVGLIFAKENELADAGPAGVY